MIVVSDSSVLINLAWIKKLELLPHLYGEVLVPTAVWQEAGFYISEPLYRRVLHDVDE